ncbi:COMM domain-containing protein 4-like [Oppia nitens]|uniref:COMM domain-containing protein 4-like n=1 Tax=Oppia nitens TaxID=1686743 RepID=UPI0023DA7BC2|nr:COMM domain-containing protein 4-like [Oppia nitens]
MRFRFCGNNDCQDWLLAQISLLSKLTSIKMKVLCNECLNDIVDNNLNMQTITKIGSEAKLDSHHIRGIVSAIQFIFMSSSKYSTDCDTLSNELQQLGLPKEHSSALCKVYSENEERLQQVLKHQSLRLNRLNQIDYKIDTQFNGLSFKVKAPALEISVDIRNNMKNDKTSFHVSHQKLSALIYELKQSLQLMDDINVN